MAMADVHISGYDMNRSYPTSNFKKFTSSRNYTGSKPLLAKESKQLATLMTNVRAKKNGKCVVIDLHGWLNETIGDLSIGKYYNAQFKNQNKISWGSGYLITWAKQKLKAKVSLVELPMPKNSKDISQRDFSGKFVKGTINMLKSI